MYTVVLFLGCVCLYIVQPSLFGCIALTFVAVACIELLSDKEKLKGRVGYQGKLIITENNKYLLTLNVRFGPELVDRSPTIWYLKSSIQKAIGINGTTLTQTSDGSLLIALVSTTHLQDSIHFEFLLDDPILQPPNLELCFTGDTGTQEIYIPCLAWEVKLY